MQQIFVESSCIQEGKLSVTGEDAHHLMRVLRMREGEQLRVSTTENENFLCRITGFTEDEVLLSVLSVMENTELPGRIYLFQGIPKGDRMETVIEKAVELGVYEIIPVDMKNCVVRIEEKKRENKIRRWQAIAESAAKQSKRSQIPQVREIMTFPQAIAYGKENCQIRLLPYENAMGMKATSMALAKIEGGKNTGILIGPEGGFAPSEIEQAEDWDIISLGKRILRTDTAAITSMSLVMTAYETNWKEEK